MDPREYEKMYDLEDRYWWYQGRKSIVLSLLEGLPDYARREGLCLDLGCGTGLMLSLFQRTHRFVGLDFSALSMRFCRRRGARRLLRGNAESLPLRGDRFQIVCSLDLAEHVERDDLMFGEVLRILRPGGHFLATVPAHPFLWSEHDEALYHQRRYTREQFRRRLLEAGFEIQRLTYCISLTFPAVIGYRLLRKAFKKKPEVKTHLVVLPGWLNRLLLASVQLEALWLRRFDIPFGVSLLAVARKPEPREG